MNKMAKNVSAIAASVCLALSSTACGGQVAEGPEFLTHDEEFFDFVLEFPEGKDITILQVTDTQAMLFEGIRTEFLDERGFKYESDNRYNQVYHAFFSDRPTDTYVRTWQYVEEGVNRTDPDLIVLTGDNIYGETDDSGELWLEMIEVLDSFEKPWFCVFGNHDNESQKGLHWQVNAVAASKYGHMLEGPTENGNSNYTVGIKQGGKMKYALYMIDTNGCRLKPHNFGESLLPYNPDLEEIQQSDGVFPDQTEWMKRTYGRIAEEYGEIPSMIFMHIPPIESYYAIMENYGDVYGTTWPLYTDRNGDIGLAEENIGGFGPEGLFFNAAKAINCKGIFLGHQHKVATSTVYDGIRFTYGLKTGTGDYHSVDMMGTTKITIKEADNSFGVEHIFTEIEYPLN